MCNNVFSTMYEFNCETDVQNNILVVHVEHQKRPTKYSLHGGLTSTYNKEIEKNLRCESFPYIFIYRHTLIISARGRAQLFRHPIGS